LNIVKASFLLMCFYLAEVATGLIQFAVICDAKHLLWPNR